MSVPLQPAGEGSACDPKELGTQVAGVFAAGDGDRDHVPL